MNELKKRERQILKFIMEEVQRRGFPPSVREIAEGVGLKSTASVYLYLNSLDEQGFIKKDKRKPRALEIMDVCKHLGLVENDKREMVEIPVLGEINAGEPILAQENIEDYFPIPLSFLRVKREDLFILRVQGDSMVEAGILSGDMAIMKQQSTAQNGEIVAALLEDEATIKRFYKLEDRIRLQPENKNHDPIYVQDVQILGILIGLFRSYH